MKTPPAIDGSVIRDALTGRWGLPGVSLSYLPVGGGSHHWLAEASDGETQRWFVTLDESRPEVAGPERLERAMATAHALRHRANLEFVVAPIPDQNGNVLASVHGGRWSLGVFPFVDVEAGEGGEFAGNEDRAEAQRLVARVHQATARLPYNLVARHDLAIPNRQALFAALDRLGSEWSRGPYADSARSLLTTHRRAVERAFSHYDALATTVVTDPSPWVITHGEPHGGNAVKRRNGPGLLLVDWDTVALAPRERDLWQLLGTGADPTLDLDAYWSVIGRDGVRTVSDAALALFRLAWDLSEIAVYVGWFAQPHADSADVRAGWDDLVASVAALQRQVPGD